jgi:Cu-Zn family superoxide dismutase
MFSRSLRSALCLLLCSAPAVLAEDKTQIKVLSAEVAGPEGARYGTINVTEAPKGVLLHLELKGLPPGWHGMHFHEKGDCADPKFMNAGAHVHAATPVVHGLLKEGANDLGDLPNLYVASDGTVTAEFYSTLVSLSSEGSQRPALLDSDGSALVIHASPDDYTTQPIGGAGARIACAVLK